MTNEHILLLAATAVAFYELGQIWFAQLIMYPLFAKVGEAEYISFHRFYSARIPLPVIIPGFASFLLPCVLAVFHPTPVPDWMAWANAACGVVGLLVTVLLEIPRHNRLERDGKHDRVIHELIAYNWPRTASVSGCALFSSLMLLATFSPV
jgi:hypothetical protein